MQTTQQQTANQQAGITLLPAKKKATNREIQPFNPGNVDTKAISENPHNGLKQPQTLNPAGPVDKAGFGMDYKTTSAPASTGGGLLGLTSANPTTTNAGANPTPTAVPQPTAAAQSASNTVTTPVMPSSPQMNYTQTQYQSVAGMGGNPTMNTPQTSFTANEYQSDGYTGVQGDTDFSYDPRAESLVQNQITGLLDPNSALMRKALSQANAYSASRGLQSSSIGSEVALSSMIDKALPIAQQDAQTYGNADQLGWQNSFNAGQANLNRTHDASMADKAGKLQTDLQNNQFSFQNTQANADRTMQAELQYLQHQQQLGLLDAQGAQRMQELNAQNQFSAQMADLQYKQQLGILDYQGQQSLQQMERNAQLTAQRDALLQTFDLTKMDKSFVMDLEKTKAQWERDDFTFAQNVSANTKLQYQNASASYYNNYLEQVAAVYSNPNMTPEQQAAGVATLKKMFESNMASLQAIYGYADTGAGVTPGAGNNNGGTQPQDPSTIINHPSNPNTGPLPITPTNPGDGTQPWNPIYDQVTP